MQRRRFIGGSAVVLAGPVYPRDGLAEQPKKLPLIGFLATGSPNPVTAGIVTAIREGLAEAGFLEGRDVAIEYRWAEGRYDRLPALAADLARRNVDVIVGDDQAAAAAKAATSTIPIVASFGGDPVESGLVASFARPGGNLTGFSLFVAEFTAKRFEILSELLPRAGVVALLVNPNYQGTERIIRDARAAAGARGVQLKLLEASTPSEIDDAFSALTQLSVDALVVGAAPSFPRHRDQFAALAARYAVPAMYDFREFVEVGGLISYGASLTGIYRQVGGYVGRVLKGEKPADLPVQQPTTFELVVNLNTAKALGLTIPPAILARADEVIE